MTIIYVGQNSSGWKTYDTTNNTFSTTSTAPTQSDIDLALATLTFVEKSPGSGQYRYVVATTSRDVFLDASLPTTPVPITPAVPVSSAPANPPSESVSSVTSSPINRIVSGAGALVPSISLPRVTIKGSRAQAQNPKLSNYIANLKSNGIPVLSHFFVQIMGIQSREVWMMCEQAMLPGMNIMTSEQRTYGELRESAFGVNYPALNLGILLDNTMNGKKLFEDWANREYNRETRTAGYYDDYVESVKVYQTDASNNVVYAVEFVESYPKTISDISLSYDSKDVLRVNFSLVYRRWIEIDYTGNPIKSRGFNPNADFTNRELRDLKRRNALPPYSRVQGSDLYDVGPAIIIAGNDLSILCGVSSSQVAGAANGAGLFSLANGFSSLTNSIRFLGGGVSSLGSNLTAFMGPISAISSATTAVAGSLGSINSLLGAVGLGNPLGQQVNNLIKISGQLGQVAGLKGVPGLIGNIGSNLTAVAGTFTNLSSSIATIPGGTSNLGNSFTNLGSVMGNQSSNLISAMSRL